MKEQKLYVVHTTRGYWVGAYIFSEQLRHAKIYTSLHYANQTAERLTQYEPKVLEVFLSLANEGEWKSGKTPNGQWGYYCSLCSASFVGENAEWIAKSHDYCPKCGAKMKGK